MQQISSAPAVEQKPVRAFHLAGVGRIEHRVGDAEPLVTSLFVSDPKTALCGFTLTHGRSPGEVVQTFAYLDEACPTCVRTLAVFRRLNPAARIQPFMVRYAKVA